MNDAVYSQSFFNELEKIALKLKNLKPLTAGTSAGAVAGGLSTGERKDNESGLGYGARVAVNMGLGGAAGAAGGKGLEAMGFKNMKQVAKSGRKGLENMGLMKQKSMKDKAMDAVGGGLEGVKNLAMENPATAMAGVLGLGAMAMKSQTIKKGLDSLMENGVDLESKRKLKESGLGLADDVLNELKNGNLAEHTLNRIKKWKETAGEQLSGIKDSFMQKAKAIYDETAQLESEMAQFTAPPSAAAINTGVTGGNPATQLHLTNPPVSGFNPQGQTTYTPNLQQLNNQLAYQPPVNNTPVDVLGPAPQATQAATPQAPPPQRPAAIQSGQAEIANIEQATQAGIKNQQPVQAAPGIKRESIPNLPTEGEASQIPVQTKIVTEQRQPPAKGRGPENTVPQMVAQRPSKSERLIHDLREQYRSEKKQRSLDERQLNQIPEAKIKPKTRPKVEPAPGGEKPLQGMSRQELEVLKQQGKLGETGESVLKSMQDEDLRASMRKAEQRGRVDRAKADAAMESKRRANPPQNAREIPRPTKRVPEKSVGGISKEQNQKLHDYWNEPSAKAKSEGRQMTPAEKAEMDKRFKLVQSIRDQNSVKNKMLARRSTPEAAAESAKKLTPELQRGSQEMASKIQQATGLDGAAAKKLSDDTTRQMNLAYQNLVNNGVSPQKAREQAKHMGNERIKTEINRTKRIKNRTQSDSERVGARYQRSSDRIFSEGGRPRPPRKGHIRGEDIPNMDVTEYKEKVPGLAMKGRKPRADHYEFRLGDKGPITSQAQKTPPAPTGQQQKRTPIPEKPKRSELDAFLQGESETPSVSAREFTTMDKSELNSLAGTFKQRFGGKSTWSRDALRRIGNDPDSSDAYNAITETQQGDTMRRRIAAYLQSKKEGRPLSAEQLEKIAKNLSWRKSA